MSPVAFSLAIIISAVYRLPYFLYLHEDLTRTVSLTHTLQRRVTDPSVYYERLKMWEIFWLLFRDTGTGLTAVLFFFF